MVAAGDASVAGLDAAVLAGDASVAGLAAVVAAGDAVAEPGVVPVSPPPHAARMGSTNASKSVISRLRFVDILANSLVC